MEPISVISDVDTPAEVRLLTMLGMEFCDPDQYWFGRILGTDQVDDSQAARPSYFHVWTP